MTKMSTAGICTPDALEAGVTRNIASCDNFTEVDNGDGHNCANCANLPCTIWETGMKSFQTKEPPTESIEARIQTAILAFRKINEESSLCGCCGIASLKKSEQAGGLCKRCEALPVDICEKCNKHLDDNDIIEAICNNCFKNAGVS